MLTSLFKKQKLEIFVRHCNFSSISHNKKRHKNFSKELCHRNFLSTIEHENVSVTFLLDTFHGSFQDHFLFNEKKNPVIEIKEGTETGSFLKLLEYVETLKLSSETIVYFLEDDYIHRMGWVSILKEAFELKTPVDYVTLYDHRDKYFLSMYQNLTSQIFYTKSTHWRTVPSTTNTYAMKWHTLKDHLEIHKQFSLGRKVSADHEKFLELGKRGSLLISPIPGWSTHAEPEFAAPCIDWEQILLATR